VAELLRWGQFERAFEMVKAALDNPKSLEPFAKRLRERARTFIDAGGEGAWPPPAPSTLAKWNAEGSSDITKHGAVRKSKLQRIEQQIGRLVKAGGARGWTDGDRRKVASLRRQVDRLRRAGAAPQAAIAKAGGRLGAVRERMATLTERYRTLRGSGKKGAGEQRTKTLQRLLALKQKRDVLEKAEVDARHRATYKGREIGERTGATRKLMPRMPGTIRAKVRRLDDRVLEVRVYSRAGEVGYYHHSGTAKGAPKRTIIPDPNAEDLEVAVQCLEGAFLKAWGGE
jgi:hypothetical protein